MRRPEVPQIIVEIQAHGGWYRATMSKGMPRYNYYLGVPGDESRPLNSKAVAKFVRQKVGRLERAGGLLRIISAEEVKQTPTRECLICRKQFEPKGRYNRMHAACREVASRDCPRVYRVAR